MKIEVLIFNSFLFNSGRLEPFSRICINWEDDFEMPSLSRYTI